MPFPEVERFRYNNAPLENVICQLRFPAVLEIESAPPYMFQNKIRNDFPLYEENIEYPQSVLLTESGTITNSISQGLSNKNYKFMSEDGVWTVNLTKSFMALSTNAYSTWEDFKWKLLPLADALKQVYNPRFYTRVGLRYINFFCRSNFGFDNCSWDELIQPYFLGLLGSEVSDNIEGMESTYEINAEDGESVIRIATELVKKIATNEICFKLDDDAFIESKIAINILEEKLNYLHERTTRVIRFAVTDKLHEAMEPERI